MDTNEVIDDQITVNEQPLENGTEINSIDDKSNGISIVDPM